MKKNRKIFKSRMCIAGLVAATVVGGLSVTAAVDTVCADEVNGSDTAMTSGSDNTVKDSASTAKTQEAKEADTSLQKTQEETKTGTEDGETKDTKKTDTTAVKVTGVKLDKTKATLTVGDTLTLKATVSPAKATNKKVVWSSSDKKIAVVDNKGNVTTKKAGTVKITVKTKDGGKTAVCTIVVKEEPKNGWQEEEGGKRFYEDDVAYTGWHRMTDEEDETKEFWCYFGNDGFLRTGWQKMGTKANPDGKTSEHWSYFGEDGRLRTGWQKMGTEYNPDGNAQVHWSYFGNNGWLRTDWQKMGTKYNPDGNSAVHWSYFGGNGWLRTGWKIMGTADNPDGNNKVHVSYFGSNGWLQTDWKKFTKADGESVEHWSYFGGNGWLWTNSWHTNKQGLHWFDNKGWMAANDPVIFGQLYNDSNGNGVLKKNTVKNGWHKWNGNFYWLVKGQTLKGYTGATQINDKGDWLYIKDGATYGKITNQALISHASGDERGKFVNGKAGDQTKGEVYFKTWINRPWQYVLRPKDAKIREKIAYAMERAARNDHIGYDMNQRGTLYHYASKVGWDPGKVTVDCETDCSALVAVALRYAGFSGATVSTSDGNLIVTGNMRKKLEKTGQFTIYSTKDYIQKTDKLIRGDILLLEFGHTAVVTKSMADMK